MELVLKLFTTLIKRRCVYWLMWRNSLHWKYQLGAGLVEVQSNKQLQRTVIRRCERASAPFHHALTARWTGQRAAAELRR
jgi:hypothetical protein